jgi:uncharacterized protein (TIGR00369 family)
MAAALDAAREDQQMVNFDLSGLLDMWRRLGTSPEGRAQFSAVIAKVAPYSGTIRPLVLELEPGACSIQIDDRPEIQNHVSSIHAAALMNLAELSGSLAMVASLPEDARAIVLAMEIAFLKKARGTLTSEAICPVPSHNERKEYEARITIRDAEGDEVATASLRLLVGPTS